MSAKNNNLTLVIFSFSVIFLLLAFSLIKNIKNKSRDEARLESSQKAETQKLEETKKNLSFVTPEEVEKMVGQPDVVLVDVRPMDLFEAYHIESSINLPAEKISTLDKSYQDKKIVLIDQAETTLDAADLIELNQKGFRLFYLEGGFEKYQALGFSVISFGYPDSPFDTAKTRPIDGQTLQSRIENGEHFQFLDVREKSEFEKFRISGSRNIPLEELETKKDDLPLGRIVIVDENPLRSFRAAVKLFDMHFIDILYLSESLSSLKK